MLIEFAKQKFEPVKITLETYEEAAALMALCGDASNVYRKFTDALYDKLEELNITSADIDSNGGVQFK